MDAKKPPPSKPPAKHTRDGKKHAPHPPHHGHHHHPLDAEYFEQQERRRKRVLVGVLSVVVVLSLGISAMALDSIRSMMIRDTMEKAFKAAFVAAASEALICDNSPENVQKAAEKAFYKMFPKGYMGSQNTKLHIEFWQVQGMLAFNARTEFRSIFAQMVGEKPSVIKRKESVDNVRDYGVSKLNFRPRLGLNCVMRLDQEEE